MVSAGIELIFFLISILRVSPGQVNIKTNIRWIRLLRLKWLRWIWTGFSIQQSNTCF